MKYYYTDQEQARWMGYRYGMRFFSPETGEYQEEAYTWDNVDLVCGDGGDRAYVHPDSLRLLEPVLGDLVTVKNAFAQYIAFVEPDGFAKCNHHMPQVFLCQRGDHSFKVTSIIQRGGKAFIWPEREEA
jgi:hypothetical protein